LSELVDSVVTATEMTYTVSSGALLNYMRSLTAVSGTATFTRSYQTAHNTFTSAMAARLRCHGNRDAE